MNLLYNILDFNSTNHKIIDSIESASLNYSKLYTTSSKHVIIPAVHNAILEKKLNIFFPEDFLQATSYITDLNNTRNTEILKQLEDIKNLFNKHEINYIFLKGCALLVLNKYRKASDRMVGDIDILVSKDHIETAKNLLLKNEYQIKDYVTDGDLVKHRHLPRMISKKWIAAVELHDKLLSKKQKILYPKDVLERKTIINNYPIPSKTDFAHHIILSQQINDYGYLFWGINYKTIYDLIVLEKDSNLNLKKDNKYVRRFFLTQQLFVKKSDELKITKLEAIKIKFLKWRLSHKKINKVYFYLIIKWYELRKLPARFFSLFISKKYRRHTLNQTINFIKKLT